MQQITIPATLDQLETALTFVREQMQKAGCPTKTAGQMELAVEEIFVNIAHYAYHPGQGPVSITCEVKGEPLCATVTFCDEGSPYDPLGRTDPDLTLDAEERQIGGLGILMVKKLMDEVIYEYRDGKNCLTMRKTG